MNIKKVAIICANGIGDGLIMMTAAAYLQAQNYLVTIFHDKFATLSKLFPALYHWNTYSREKIIHFDLIIAQYDGSHVSQELLHLRLHKNFPQVIMFFPYKNSKSQSSDLIFNRSITMIDNITCYMQNKFPSVVHLPLLKNHILIPKKEYRKYPRRIIIHPTSANPRKNWTPIQFVILAKKLREFDYYPIFMVPPNESSPWKSFLSGKIPLQSFEDLVQVGDYIYESGGFIGNDSGLGHLASRLDIPTLTIFSKNSLSPLWNPGVGIYKVLTPCKLPNYKGISLPIREWVWPLFISTQKVLTQFFLLMKEYNRTINKNTL